MTIVIEGASYKTSQIRMHLNNNRFSQCRFIGVHLRHNVRHQFYKYVSPFAWFELFK